MSKTNRRFLQSILVILVAIAAGWYAYDTYGRDYYATLWEVNTATVYIGSLPLSATIADTPAERRQGLSNVRSLEDLETMLFVFPESGYHGMWMKDMLIPIDILWVNEDFEIVHIEENVRPETYPTVFRPPQPARFVLEGRAFLVESNAITVGDRVTIPPLALPSDLTE